MHFITNKWVDFHTLILFKLNITLAKQLWGKCPVKANGKNCLWILPWEASMAPAVSWKSSSCCKNKMACVAETMLDEEPLCLN